MAEQDSSRPTAHEIFDEVLQMGRDELRRSSGALAFSGVAAGLGMGLTALGVAAAHVALDGGNEDFLANLLYPLGFVAVIIGRQQLFTENTLYPVALVLDERRREHVTATARLWTVVFAANVVGALLFALLAARTGALGAELEQELLRLGSHAVDRPLDDVFWSAVVAGWVIALVAWLVTAAQWTVGHVAVIWLLTFLVGLAGLAHCIASSTEILAGVVEGTIGAGDYLLWLAVATAGNVLGGVGIVTALNYGQVAQ
jgi:formate/nitrite transporter FocA (FNT family)